MVGNTAFLILDLIAITYLVSKFKRNQEIFNPVEIPGAIPRVIDGPNETSIKAL